MELIGTSLGWKFLIVVLALLGSGCTKAQNIPGASNLTVEPLPVVSRAKVQSSNLVGGGKSYRKEDGWPIPAILATKAKKDKVRVSALNGQSKILDVSQIDFEETELTMEPYRSIGSDIGTLKFHDVLIYSIHDKIFCYKFDVVRVKIDANSNGIISSGGMLLSFAYYDEDGDGLFETAILQEKGPNGSSDFRNPPHLPEWILNK